MLFLMVMHSNSALTWVYRSWSFGDLGQRTLVSCLSISSKDFFSETTGQILSKFHMQTPDKGVRKLYIWSRSLDKDGCHTCVW